MNKVKEEWIDKQCKKIDECMSKNNSRRAFQVVKELTKQKQARVMNIEDKDGKCITEKKAIIERWTEYCLELYNHQAQGDPNVLTCQNWIEDDDFPILREEIEAAVKSLKKGKAAGVDNIPAELIKYGGTTVTDFLTKIYNKIWQSGEWPTAWNHSSLRSPKKAIYNNAKTIAR